MDEVPLLVNSFNFYRLFFLTMGSEDLCAALTDEAQMKALNINNNVPHASRIIKKNDVHLSNTVFLLFKYNLNVRTFYSVLHSKNIGLEI